jgi:hypothetical protein
MRSGETIVHTKVRSTGVLVKDPASFNAHVDIMNIDPALSQTVTVAIFDWGVDQQWSNPTPVPVSPPGPVTIGPHTHQSFIALISQSTAQPGLALSMYEIRVTVPDVPQLVVNCFAHDASGNIIEGNTVRHDELVEIGSAIAECCVNSIIDLKALNAVAVQCLTVLGYHAPGDGGGGEFYWDASSSETDNGGTIIVPVSNPATGRWKRLVDGPLSVKWFGAKGDAVDDTAAIRAAVGAGAGTVTLPPGIYRITSTIVISTACRLLGLGAGPGGNSTVGYNDEHGAILEWAPPVAADSMFLVTGVYGNVGAGVGSTFENLLFRQAAGNGRRAQGNAIRIGNASTTDTFKPSWTRIRNCTFEVGAGKDDWTYCIYLDGSGTSGPKLGSGIRDTWIENIRCVSGPNATGSIYAKVVGNLYILDSLMNLANGNITVTGTDAAHFSSGIFLNNVNIATLALDRVQQVIAVGGIWNTVNTTANTNHCDLRPGYLVNSPTFYAGDSSLCVGVLATLGGPIWVADQGIEFRSQSLRWRAAVQGNIGTADDQDFAVVTNSISRLLVKSTGSVNLAPGGAIATNATDGFTYIPTCVGVPTGVPTTQTGSVAMVYDTANNNFYIYNGAWKKVGLT